MPTFRLQGEGPQRLLPIKGQSLQHAGASVSSQTSHRFGKWFRRELVPRKAAPPASQLAPVPHPQPPLPGVTRARASPSANTHHIPLLHTVAALNEGGPGGNAAACRGDVTLRSSKDGVGPGLAPFLPIPTILQGNSNRVSTPPPSSHSNRSASPSPLWRILSCLFTHHGN